MLVPVFVVDAFLLAKISVVVFFVRELILLVIDMLRCPSPA